MKVNNGYCLGNVAYQKLIRLVNEMFGLRIETISVKGFLEEVNYEQLLLVHDKHDKILDYKNSLSLKKSLGRTTLIPFTRVGHYRMLWNHKVIQTVSDFLNTKKQLTEKQM